MQAGRQDLVDAGILQVGQQFAGTPPCLGALLVLHLFEVIDHLDQAGVQ